MHKHLLFLSVPGLRVQDLERMPNLHSLVGGNTPARIRHGCPAMTWPSQAAMLTGKTPEQHGVVANGFYWRDSQTVEMWTAWNEVIQSPQVWESLRKIDGRLTSAVWFPMLSKGSKADYICMPAPIHKPDGSEELWCYTRPQEFYGELLQKLGHFPLQHFWGPVANIKSSKWIAESALVAARQFQPNFFYIYLPHLDYAAQKTGPDSEAAQTAVVDLDSLIGELATEMQVALPNQPQWMVASEYTITSVDHASFPNRVLRDAGLLQVRLIDGRELIDFENSHAWALVDHQISHVFVSGEKAEQDATIAKVLQLFDDQPGIEKAYAGEARAQVGLNHERAGEVVLLSTKNSWQAYYWWLDDSLAPDFARTVDIHRKPGYDPVELHFDAATRSIPLDASLIKGSHGLPATDPDQMGVFLTSGAVTSRSEIADTDVFELILDFFRG